jgi:hypothetical protein
MSQCSSQPGQTFRLPQRSAKFESTLDETVNTVHGVEVGSVTTVLWLDPSLKNSRQRGMQMEANMRVAAG